jgi:hypothetical protein
MRVDGSGMEVSPTWKAKSPEGAGVRLPSVSSTLLLPPVKAPPPAYPSAEVLFNSKKGSPVPGAISKTYRVEGSRVIPSELKLKVKKVPVPEEFAGLTKALPE